LICDKMGGLLVFERKKKKKEEMGKKERGAVARL
jgi:hypothetical protein